MGRSSRGAWVGMAATAGRPTKNHGRVRNEQNIAATTVAGQLQHLPTVKDPPTTTFRLFHGHPATVSTHFLDIDNENLVKFPVWLLTRYRQSAHLQ